MLVTMGKINGQVLLLLGTLVMTSILVSSEEHYDLFLKEEDQFVEKTFMKSYSELGVYENAAVASDSPHCSEIGKDMLVKGGSVIDAAIATLLCVGVIQNQSMGVGGGFFMVLYNATTRESSFLNARETAPGAAYENMFEGNWTRARYGGLASAVPGEFKGYQAMHDKYGRLPWKDLFTPSIQFLRNGFQITSHAANALWQHREWIKNEESMAEVFVNPETNEVYEEGDFIKRPILAETLEAVATHGADIFYHGEVGKRFVEDVQGLGGIITEEDLRNYKVEESKTLETNIWSDYHLHLAPPPASGILTSFVLQLLSTYIEESDVDQLEPSIVLYQRVTEAFKHAYARRTYMGDPSDPDVREDVEELVANLTSSQFISDIRKLIMDDQTNNTYEYYGAEFYQNPDHGTSHVSVIGPDGDAVAITSTVNLHFGAKVRSRQTGIILNNEMDDFSAPNITNNFGVPPSPNNFIVPGKRPVSSMTPLIVTDSNGKVRLAVGAAGGTKITTSTTLVTMATLLMGRNIKEAIDAPRIHHQLYPMSLQYEDGFDMNYIKQLERMGHALAPYATGSSVVIGIQVAENGTIFANNDYRKDGSVAGY